MNIGATARGFDAELAFDDLFTPVERSQWSGWLSALAPCRVDIVPPDAPAARQAHAVVLEHELEPLLALVAGSDLPQPDLSRPTQPPHDVQLPSELVALFSAHVRERIRYRLASCLQTHASAHDWAALQASEARYRTLAGELERRVQTQVADLQRARLYAFQTEQQRAVAQLAAGMAHEINNPIGFIAANLRSAQAYLQELQERQAAHQVHPAQQPQQPQQPRQAGPAAEAALFSDFRELLQECAEGAARVAAIVGQLRVFSQVDAASVTAVRPLALVQAALALLASGQPAGVTVQVQGDPEPWTCEAAAVSQAIWQLLRNAFQAMAGRQGEVCVLLQHDTDGRSIAVSDVGCGMGEDVRSRACDPFFSTRDVGQGMGLGLSVAAEVARHHGGRLELASTPGQGTRACLLLGPEPAGAA